MAQPVTLFKLIILYMLSRVDYPLTNSQISEFILEREYTNYFQLQQTLSEMAESNLIATSHIGNTSYYRILDTGISTLGFFEEEISPEIREDIENYLTQNGCELRAEVSAVADYYQATTSGFMVRLRLKERQNQLIDMTVHVPTEEAASAICGNWPVKCHDVYGYLMETLI